MKKKNGFISTTIIYSFFLVFILIMIAILMSYANKAFLKDKIADNITDPGDNKEEDGYLNCNKGVDKLSDCLFLAEAREASELSSMVSGSNWWNKFDETNVTNNDKLFRQYYINMGLKPSAWLVTPKEGNPDNFDISDKVREIKYKIYVKTSSYFNKTLDLSSYGKTSIDLKLGEPSIFEEGMYRAVDDYYESSGEYTYYYRGAEDDNYVLFDDKLWQIIRINGDGSIRLIYQGDKLVNNTNTIENVKDNVKEKSYINVDGNSDLDTNDARHFNYNKMGELKCDSYVMAMKANAKYIEKFCEIDRLKNGILDKIETGFCSLSEENRKKALNKINSCGNQEYNGAVSLWNVGFMRNPSPLVMTEDKLDNKVNSDLLNILKAWYDSNLIELESYLSQNTLFCGNKDVATSSGVLTGIDYLEKNHCYCEKSSIQTQPKYNLLEHDPSLFATWTCTGVNYGTCHVNNYDHEGGLQINYYTLSSQKILRNELLDFKCGSGNNSKFSAGISDSSTTKIDVPVGLINTIELIMAGSAYNEENNTMFLSTSFPYWTADLAFGNNNNGLNDTFYFIMNGNNVYILNDYKKSSVAYIKPVINLESDVIYDGGKGTIDDPYTIKKGS